MTTTSQWPLSPDGIRFVVPEFMISQLSQHPLTKDCYPVALGYYPNAFGHRMERQQHQDHLLIYCTDGKGIVAAKGSTVGINAGDILVLPKGIAHRYQATTNAPWSIYWIHFAGGLCDNFLEPLLNEDESLTVLSPGAHAKIVSDFETLLEVRQTGYNQRNFIHASNLLRQLLSYLSATHPLTTTKEGIQFDLDAVHALMQEKLHSHLALEELAEKVNLSKYHFSSKYKAITGQSPIQHFLHLKMEHACYLLDISGHSIKAISRDLGYEDNYYFSRLFKKIIGVSPQQYRQLKRG
ncbi:MAG TPA: AraC family transcriptional regulator [Porticoccus sp.]|nr:AraC family transcriptional regulator [Porticoccus sp.]